MPRFCNCGCGGDMCICQNCGRDVCSKETTWIEDGKLNGLDTNRKGNICNNCIKNHSMTIEAGAIIFFHPKKENKQEHISLFEHCKRESGLTDTEQIKAYMNRHYGFM